MNLILILNIFLLLSFINIDLSSETHKPNHILIFIFFISHIQSKSLEEINETFDNNIKNLELNPLMLKILEIVIIYS